MNILSKTALATACALSFSLVAPSAEAALTAEQKRRYSFAAASSTAWGTAIIFNGIMSIYVQRTRGEEVWGLAAAASCGMAAAGILNEWSPDKTVVSAQALMYAVMKAGSVIWPSTSCRWATIGVVKGYHKEFTTKVNNGTGKWVFPTNSNRTEARVNTVQADFYRARDLYVQLKKANADYQLKCRKVSDISVMHMCMQLSVHVQQLNDTYSGTLNKTKTSLKYMVVTLDREANDLKLDIKNP